MLTRVVEVGNPARLHLRNRQVIVERESLPATAIPLDDLGLLILDNPQISITHSLMQACAAHGVSVITCDTKHLPTAALLPFAGHSLHAKMVQAQADVRKPHRKRIWQQIIKAKITAQAHCLSECIGAPGPLPSLCARVRSGDPTNVEAHAAAKYWPLLFGDKFRRDQEAVGINSLLNYGYSIIRSAVARALVGSGLHPGLGIHHCNQYNPYALADDLMEPLRPLVDKCVFQLCKTNSVPELCQETKKALLSITNNDCRCDDSQLPFFVALPRYTASVSRALLGEVSVIFIPMPK